MNLTIEFTDVLCLVNADIQEKCGNLKCPFCGVQSFKIYRGMNETAKCHNKKCGWNGNALQFYAKYKDITYKDAFKELAESLRLGEIKFSPKIQTYDEALDEFAEDLNFLAWCRMYFAFYRRNITQKTFYEKAGLSQSAFNKILNGNIGDKITWRRTLSILRNDVPINQLKKDMKMGAEFFKIDIDKAAVSKFRIKGK